MNLPIYIYCQNNIFIFYKIHFFSEYSKTKDFVYPKIWDLPMIQLTNYIN